MMINNENDVNNMSGSLYLIITTEYKQPHIMNVFTVHDIMSRCEYSVWTQIQYVSDDANNIKKKGKPYQFRSGHSCTSPPGSKV